MTTSQNNIRFCPRCFSTEIKRVTSNAATGALGLPSGFYCESCSLSLPSFPEDTPDGIKIIENESKTAPVEDFVDEEFSIDSQPVNTVYGKFVMKFWWKIGGPMMLIYALILGIGLLTTEGKTHLTIAFYAFLIGGLSMTIVAFKK